MHAELHQLGDLGASPLCGSHNSWHARCVDRLFTGRSWRLGFTIGRRQGDTVGGVPTSSFRLPGGSQSAPICRLIIIHNPRQQLGKSTVKSLTGINWEMGIFV